MGPSLLRTAHLLFVGFGEVASKPAAKSTATFLGTATNFPFGGHRHCSIWVYLAYR